MDYLKKIEDLQKKICEKHGIDFYPCDLNLKVGVSLNVKQGVQPIKGMRIKDTGGSTSGWYIFAGEYSEAPDFYQPLCGIHLCDWAPMVLPYLGLPPNWTFIIDNHGYEDVWMHLNNAGMP